MALHRGGRSRDRRAWRGTVSNAGQLRGIVPDMGRPRGSVNVHALEYARIRELFLAGMRVADIMKATGRGESTVYHAAKDLSRKRPPPPGGRYAKRNDRILELVEKGWSRAAIGRRYKLSPTQVSTVVSRHPRIVELVRKGRMKPAEVARRFRMELSTVLRILRGSRVERTRLQAWTRP